MKNEPHYSFIGKNFKAIEGKTIKDEIENKRYKLEARIDDAKLLGTERCLVILKNPSRAGLVDIYESDKTVNTVCQYFYCRRNTINAQVIVIMNLFPVYGTDSDKLHLLDHSALIDSRNKNLLEEEIELADKIVFAWGTHPVKCHKPFEEMKQFILPLTQNKICFQMQHPKFKINPNRPLHGQVWGYEDYELIRV